MASLRKLDVLDLHSNAIQAMEGLESLQELRVLNLAGNRIRYVAYRAVYVIDRVFVGKRGMMLPCSRGRYYGEIKQIICGGMGFSSFFVFFLFYARTHFLRSRWIWRFFFSF